MAPIEGATPKKGVAGEEEEGVDLSG